jgi:hypothetical protein
LEGWTAIDERLNAMTFHFPSTPPAPNVGDISPLTVALRPASGLTEEQEEFAREMKRRDPSLSATTIAAQVGGSEEGVLLALRNLRTRNPRRSRATINGTLEAAAFLANEALNGEPRWQTLDRVLGELAYWRALAGLPPTTPRNTPWTGRRGAALPWANRDSLRKCARFG